MAQLQLQLQVQQEGLHIAQEELQQRGRESIVSVRNLQSAVTEAQGQLLRCQAALEAEQLVVTDVKQQWQADNAAHVTELHKQVTESAEMRENMQLQLQSSSEDSRNLIASLQQRLDAANVIIALNHEQITVVSTNLSELQCQLLSEQRTNEQRQSATVAEVTQLQLQLQECRQQLLASEETVSAASTAAETTQAQLQEYADRLQAFDSGEHAESFELRTQVSVLQAELAEATATLALRAVDFARLQSDLADASLECEEVRQAARAAEAVIPVLEQEIERVMCCECGV